MLPRSKNDDKILVLENGKEVLRDKKEARASLGVDGFVRIWEDEFKQITQDRKFLAHFNLEHSRHEVGRKYALVKVLRGGSYRGVDQVEDLPLLSLEYFYMAECVEVKNYLKYKDITPEYFTHSLPHIQSVEDLKAVMWQRYSTSMPGLTKDKIQDLGVGYTLLKFLE